MLMCDSVGERARFLCCNQLVLTVFSLGFAHLEPEVHWWYLSRAQSFFGVTIVQRQNSVDFV